MPEELSNLLLVTVHPGHVSPDALRRINTVLIVGREPRKFVEEFAGTIHTTVPDVPESDLGRGEALLWEVDRNRVTLLKADPSRSEHHRHRRKYAEGQLEPARTFHFRRAEGKLDLRSQNLNMFVQIAEGIDNNTWMFHLKRADYSRWISDALGDRDLADEIETIETNGSLSPQHSKDLIKERILSKYTTPASHNAKT